VVSTPFPSGRNVENCYVRRCCRDPVQGFLDPAGLADHLEAILRLQQVARPTSNNLVVVNKNDT